MKTETIELLNLFVTLCTLGTTVFFTRQLVKNDNRRHEWMENERIERFLKTQLRACIPAVGIERPKELRRIITAFRHDLPLVRQLCFEIVSEIEDPSHAKLFEETARKIFNEVKEEIGSKYDDRSDPGTDK